MHRQHANHYDRNGFGDKIILELQKHNEPPTEGKIMHRTHTNHYEYNGLGEENILELQQSKET